MLESKGLVLRREESGQPRRGTCLLSIQKRNWSDEQSEQQPGGISRYWSVWSFGTNHILNSLHCTRYQVSQITKDRLQCQGSIFHLSYDLTRTDSPVSCLSWRTGILRQSRRRPPPWNNIPRLPTGCIGMNSYLVNWPDALPGCLRILGSQVDESIFAPAPIDHVPNHEMDVLVAYIEWSMHALKGLLFRSVLPPSQPQLPARRPRVQARPIPFLAARVLLLDN